jgi:hypothetical protein
VIATPIAAMMASPTRIGSQTMTNQMPAVARAWRTSTRLPDACSISLFGSNPCCAVTTGSGLRT